MRHLKTIKSISLIIILFLITSCLNNSAMKPEDFKNKQPRLIIEEYLAGNVKSKFRKVGADEFIVATLLPVQRFKKQSDKHVFAKSRGMF